MDERAYGGGEAGGNPGGTVHSSEPELPKPAAASDPPRQACLPLLDAQLPRAAGGGAGAVAALLAIDGYGHEARHADHAEPAVPPPEPAEPVAQVIPAPELTAPAGEAAEFAAQPLPPVEPVEAEAHSDEAGLPAHIGKAEPGAAAGALENGATDEPAGGVEAMVTMACDAAPQSQPLTEDGDLAPAALDSTAQPLLTYPDELPQPGAGESAGVNEVGIAATAPASEALPGASPALDDAASPTAVPAPPEQAEAATGQPEAPGGEKPDPEPAVSRPVPVPPLETVSHLIPEVQRAPVENAPALTPSVAPVLRPFAPEAAAPREAVSPVTPTPPPTYFDPHPLGREQRPGPVPPPPPARDAIAHAPPLRPAAPAVRRAAALSPAPPMPAEAPARPGPHVRPGKVRRVLRAALAVLLAVAVLQAALLILYRWVDPPTSMLMLGQRLTGTPITQRWVPLERMSPNLLAAVISSEDGHFCRHHGVDWGELREAIESAADGSARGGSTITMQVVKNVFLWPSRSYVRKAIEIPMAYAMELLWPKRRILEVYLNVAEWGPGIFGAEAAARYHFRKPALLLSQREAALLAVSLPNPIERQAGRPGPGTVRLADNLLLRLKASYPNTRCARIRALDDRAG